MVLNIGLRVLNTSSLSIPEPSWMHKRQANEAAARCSSPLPKHTKSNKFRFMASIYLRNSKFKHAAYKPFFKQRSMLSVIVILLSKINSCRILVAMAVFNPSRAPCLVLALEGKKKKKKSWEHWINVPLRHLWGTNHSMKNGSYFETDACH